MAELTTKKLCDWIRPQITTGARVIPGRIPDTPNRVIGIVMGSSPGLEMDGLFDIIGFQVTCRGGENNLDDAEKIAFEVDKIMTGNGPEFSSENFMLEDVYVSQVSRTGGRPSQLTLPDSQSRYTFTCNYVVNIATDIGVYNG